MTQFFGILSAAIFLLADIPYLRNVLRGTIKPHRTTWLLAGFLNTVNIFNQIAAGATTSLPFFVVVGVLTSAIGIASIWKGTGGLSRSDIICAGIALLGVIAWLVFRTPTVSIVANIIAASASLVPTFIKSYRHPHTETHLTWLLGMLSTVCTVLAVGRLDWALIILPIHGILIQGGLYAVLVLRSRHLRRAQMGTDAIGAI